MHCARIRGDGKIQTIKEHCDNVSELCEKFGGKIGLSQTAKLMGLLHDAGKAKREFTEYIEYCHAHPEDFSRRGTVDHATAGARFAYNEICLTDETAERVTAQLIALAICSHHGGLIDCIDSKRMDSFTERVCKKEGFDYDESIMNYQNECYSKGMLIGIFSDAIQEINTFFSRIMKDGDKQQRPFYVHLLAKYLFSCLVDADGEDAYRFMADLPPEEEEDTLPLWKELLKNLDDELRLLPHESGLDHLRQKISRECKDFAKRPGGIYKLAVPTGGGKTLSSLRYALEHSVEYDKKHIFYIAPYISILDQTADEIKKKLKRDDVVFEHHSNIIRENEGEESGLFTPRYNMPIVLTTMVQFLNTFYSTKTQNIRRLHQMANAVIILDEIQTLPIKCVHMLNSTLNFLAEFCGSTIILCTATQPRLQNATIPLNINPDADLVLGISEKFAQFKRVELKNLCKPMGYSADELARLVLNEMQSCKSMLLVMNTKRVTSGLYQALEIQNRDLPPEKQYKLYHLSTNMCPAHRMEVLKEIIGKLKTQRVVCVSTQLIEAGINISFECVIRALAGLDSIVQAAGRCNRHNEKAQGKAYIVNLKDEKLEGLEDIRKGAECTKHVLYEFEADPDSLGGDLLSPMAMERYYELYFDEQKNEMSYNLKQFNTTMYDLLSGNGKFATGYLDRVGHHPRIKMLQAFKTAAENFEVIDSGTTSVLVPYGDEGERLIAQLNGDLNLRERKLLLKKAQQYSVSLFKTEYQNLDRQKALYPIFGGDAIALQEGYYHPMLGIVREKEEMEFLNK